MAGFLAIGFLAIQLNNELPSADSISNIELKIPLRIYTSEGLLVSEFGDERRKPLNINDTPQVLINAVLAAEDDSFFDHHGIDFKGLIRAAVSNFSSSGGSRQGASTITMQVARNFYLSRDQTYTRKIKELFLAIKLEQVLSKQEILSLYLNKIFLGHRAYGFAAAADAYYGKPLQELSTAEISMLAGLPKAPSTFNPISNPDRALIRRNYVLGRLNELKKINDSDYQSAFSEPITAKKHQVRNEVPAPHIAEMVRAQLIQQFGPNVYWKGYDVITTIQANKQIAAEKALRKGLQNYDRRHGFRGAIERIDLAKQIKEQELEKNSEELRKFYSKILSKHPNSHEQTPALITSVESLTAIAETKAFGSITLKLENAKWAKQHRTQNIIGEKPTTFKKLLTVGDIVYVSPLQSIPEDNTQNLASIDWGLSQIPDVGGAIISINPKTGSLEALVGGYDFFLNKYNRATQSIRQPGSNIKPFIYSASLDKGFTPATLISGAPIVMRDPTHGTLWRPENYSGKFFGPTRMRTALAKSMNLVSIRLLRSIGIPFTREYISRFGIDMNRFSASLTMALGSGGVTPIDMLSAYGVLANGGYRVKPYFIERITDRNGHTIFQAPKARLCDECYDQYLFTNIDNPNTNKSELNDTNNVSGNQIQQNLLGAGSLNKQAYSYDAPRVMSTENNFLTVSMLKDVVTRGTARKALVLKRKDLAGKTGTTNDYVDAWFSGFNSNIATTVWVGFDKPKSMGRGEAGGVAALPIWIDYMATALKGVSEEPIEIPELIEEGYINRSTGKVTTEDDPDAITEYFARLQPIIVGNNTPDASLLTDTDTSLPVDSNYPESTDLDKKPSDNPTEVFNTNNLDNQRIIETPEDTQGLF